MLCEPALAFVTQKVTDLEFLIFLASIQSLKRWRGMDFDTQGTGVDDQLVTLVLRNMIIRCCNWLGDEFFPSATPNPLTWLS